jgi:hypothetical protein
VWRRVRRAPVADFGYSQVVLSDGAIFVRGADPATVFDEEILVYPPAGGMAVAWREADETTVRAHIGDELLVGPP